MFVKLPFVPLTIINYSWSIANSPNSRSVSVYSRLLYLAILRGQRMLS